MDLSHLPALEPDPQAHEPRRLRGLIAKGSITGTSRGLALGYLQCNLAMVPQSHAGDFLEYCKRNARACPVLEVTAPGHTEPRRLAPGADLRTDCARYALWRDGHRLPDCHDIIEHWRADLVSFLIGSGITFDEAFEQAGIGTGQHRWVIRSQLPTVAVGPFQGPLIVTMRWLTPVQAELASMSMELFSFDHWHHFYADEADARAAKREHLTKIMSILTWVAVVDRFQHWIYTHKGHTAAERNAAWMQILREFGTGVVDHEGFENERAYQWQRQLHIYEVPFYYIEYAMAQLGAIALWRDYRKDPEATLDRYEAALALGYTRPIGEIYRTAGIRFDFSQNHVKELMAFVMNEYDLLK